MDHVILVTFRDAGHAQDGMDELRLLDERGEVDVRAAAVVERSRDGAFQVPERAESLGVHGSVAGGVIGALVGALAGPLGLLVGGMTGVAVGSIADAKEADRAGGAVGAMASMVLPGGTALVADVDESGPDAVDRAMGPLGGTVFRRPRLDVEAELATVTTGDGEAAGAAPTVRQHDAPSRRLRQR